MEYYAKSPTFILDEKREKQIAEKLDAVLDVFYDEAHPEDYKLLSGYTEKLETGHIETKHTTLKQHLTDIINCAEHFFQLYGTYFSDKEKKMILDACRLHDIGKTNYIFQTKVNKNLKKVNRNDIPHGFLSAMTLSEKDFLKNNPQCNESDFSVLFTAIFYHHTRSDIYEDEELDEYCQQFYLPYIREYLEDDTIEIYTENKLNLLFEDKKSKGMKSVKEDIWCQYMLIKGMLNKFDWTVSAGYEEAEVVTDRTEKRLCQNIEQRWNGNFRPAQKFMMENKDRNVVIIAPTGSGKTEAALMWLNGEKGFYTLPLKVSSNAIYDRIREEYQYEDAALLHSDSINNYLKRTGDAEKGYKDYEQAKLLSDPLTVCTVDQLFKFVYKALGTEIFAATLKYSKIIIDEIQSYEPRILAALIFGLSEIKRMGGKFAIITATLPPVVQYFIEKKGLLEGSDYLYHDFSDTAIGERHRLKLVEDDFHIEEIAEAGKQKKVLVICNTVSKAQKVYQNLDNINAEPRLLHSRFTREHREILEKNIKVFSEDTTKTGIWVTTQIVEASLDIDFDILYTEMCTADSLIQRMGRCNRAGKKNTDIPNIIIYCNNSGVGTVYDEDIYKRSVSELEKYEGILFSEPDKVNYINKVYDWKKIRKTNYFRQIENMISHFETLSPQEYDLKEAQEDFRKIKSISVIPDQVYNENYTLIETIRLLLEEKGIDKSIRKLLKSKLENMTLSLNLNYGVPNGIEGKVGSFDIYRTSLRYDFNGKAGLGLQLNKMEDEAYFM